MSETVPMPSQRRHMPPTTLKPFSIFLPFTTRTPEASAEATLKANAFCDPMCGLASRLKRMRSSVRVGGGADRGAGTAAHRLLVDEDPVVSRSGAHRPRAAPGWA